MLREEFFSKYPEDKVLKNSPSNITGVPIRIERVVGLEKRMKISPRAKLVAIRLWLIKCRSQ
jgi:hypothetical protein